LQFSRFYFQFQAVLTIILQRPAQLTSNNNINFQAASNLSAPPNNATGIDTNSNFTYSVIAGGLYQITFNTPNRSFTVFTSSTSGYVGIPNFSSYGLGLGASLNYSWRVSRFPNVSSVDAFVNTSIYNNAGYDEVTQSESRNFTSAP
jgi:hypothetical protein